MSLPKTIFDPFERLTQTNQAVKQEIPFSTIGRNFTVVDQSAKAEEKAQEFWQQDRRIREMQNNEKIRTIKISEADQLAEMDEADLESELVDSIEDTPSIFSL